MVPITAVFDRSRHALPRVAVRAPHRAFVLALPRAFALALLPAFALALALAWPGAAAYAADLSPGTYWWYVPEHEKYARTQFFTEPSFNAGLVRITRTERFRLVGGSRGWGLLEFDSGVKAYIYLRLLRSLVHDPAASDPWYEFKRASVFPEEPEKIEARLKPGAAEPKRADTKTPVWKRYKDSWNVNKGRSASAGGSPEAELEPGASRAPEKKARSKYPLLPPIGSEPTLEPDSAGATGTDAERGAAAPAR